MIPDKVKEFLSYPGTSGTAVIASRDAQLQPNQIRVFGAKVHPNQTTVTCYIDELRSEQMITNFENNGRVAFTIVGFVENESYQLKGKFVSWRRTNEQEHQFQDDYKAQVREHLKQMGMPEEIIANWGFWPRKPGVAITFDVEKVFGQAPRPDTGKLISE
jgi:hypothetical protein